MPEQQWIFAHILYPRIIFIIIIKRIKSRGGRRCCTIPIRVSWLWENCNSNNSVGTSLLQRGALMTTVGVVISSLITTLHDEWEWVALRLPLKHPSAGYLCCYGNAFSIFSSVWLNWSSPQAKKLLFYLTPILVVLIILLLDCTILPDWSSSWVDDIQWMFAPSTLTHYSGYSHFFYWLYITMNAEKNAVSILYSGHKNLNF